LDGGPRHRCLEKDPQLRLRDIGQARLAQNIDLTLVTGWGRVLQRVEATP
jgi:hypothetical protein